MNTSSNSLPDARTMSAGYSDSEDRLWLRFGAEEGAVQFWMTRRLLASALPQIWSLLVRTAALSPGAPDDTPNRQAALVAEREVVLQAKASTSTAEAREQQPRAMEHRPVQAGLLSRILAERKGARIKLSFIGGGGQVSMTCGRAELIRMLNMLAKRARASGWPLEVPWKDAGASPGH